jgi:hypothetical protein
MMLPVADAAQIGGDELADSHHASGRDDEPVRERIVQERRHDRNQCTSDQLRRSGPSATFAKLRQLAELR